jgi:Na+-driven multidrug efflux pump
VCKIRGILCSFSCTFCSTRVSNEIGAGNIDRAKNAVAVTLKLSVFLGLSFILLLGFGHGLWASLFSGSSVIAAKFAAITPFMMMSIVLDSAQGILSGKKKPSASYLDTYTILRESLFSYSFTWMISYYGHKIRD